MTVPGNPLITLIIALAITGGGWVLAEKAAVNIGEPLQEEAALYDEYGFDTYPICDTEKEFMMMMSGTPSGIKGQNEHWALEIYIEPEGGSWTVVGERKAATPSDLKVLCELTFGPGDYTQEKWYVDFFRQENPSGLSRLQR